MPGEESKGSIEGDQSGLATALVLGSVAAGLPWMASYTSWRCTGTSFGATMPRRTLSPRISTTVTVMSLLMTMLSFFLRDSTNIAVSPFGDRAWVPVTDSHAPGYRQGTISLRAG